MKKDGRNLIYNSEHASDVCSRGPEGFEMGGFNMTACISSKTVYKNILGEVCKSVNISVACCQNVSEVARTTLLSSAFDIT